MIDPYPPPYGSAERRRYEWKCPLVDCGHLLEMIGPKSLQIAIELHQLEHAKKVRLYGTTDYDKLYLTPEDKILLADMKIGF